MILQLLFHVHYCEEQRNKDQIPGKLIRHATLAA